MGRRSLQASVYGTTPGKYRRTGNLRRLFGASVVSPGKISIYSRAGYASYVERTDLSSIGIDLNTGNTTGMNGWSPRSNRPPYMGRSGAQYWMPGPHVSAAGLRALWAAKAAIVKEVKKAAKGV